MDLKRRITIFLKALAAGERWVTIHPPGHDKGQPILIKQMPDGSAKVIGGAGGKLSHLRLTGVRSEDDYKAEASSRAKSRREEKKRQGQRDREMGLSESKAAAREVVRAREGQQEAKFVQSVAQAMGWSEEDMRFPAERFQDKPEAVRSKAEARHARELLQRAHQAVENQRRRLLDDAEARAEVGLGEVPLTAATPDQISVQDLDPVEPSTKGFGYTTEYGKRAERAGLTAAELQEEAAAAKPDAKPRAVGERVRDDLELLREAAPAVDPAKLVDAKAAVELLKAEKELKAVRKQAREKRQQIDAAKEPVEPKAYVLEVGSQHVDKDVVKGLEDDLRTIRTRAFLDEAGKVGDDAIGRHVGVGAFNSINAVALAAGGASLVDRSVVDVLGIAGAAQVLARRLHTDLTREEMGELSDAMGKFHVEHYMGASDAALREARSWQEMAQEIDVGEAATGAELAVAQELNAKRAEFVGNAQRTLGTALGEMEANAALVMALGQPPKKQVQVSLGRTRVEDAIRQARAIGLQRGEYQIERIGASTMLTVSEAGMDRLAQPVSREDLARTKSALDIINGRQDEEGWLPAGVADRPDLAMNIAPGAAPRLAKPFQLGPEGVEKAIEDYIGGRAADGDNPADIINGLLSEDVLRQAGNRDAFMAALDRIAPQYGPNGEMIRAEAHAGRFEELADKFVQGRGLDGVAPLHRQKFEVDQTSVDALHRALAAHPEGVAAFKPIGDLTPQDQRALREVFTREYGKVDPAAEGIRAELEKHTKAEPEREVDDMFGRAANPAHTDWRARRDELGEQLNKATMTWGKYLEVMGSPANAYAAMQDVVRGRLVDSFGTEMNRLRPGKPMKLGRTVISNDLAHLDALDPGTRDRRLADRRELVDRLRNRVAGKYAAGGVGDKLDAARAAEEAQEQAQLGMFGAEEMGESGGKGERPLELGERRTIGHAAERQLAGMLPIVGANFKPGGAPVTLWRPTMSGKYVQRQRAVKLIRNNRRQVLGLGVGSGKTSISLAAFTDLHSTGDAKRGLYLVPSVVQGQFHGEALTMLEPGKYQWHCQPGASREERIAAYKDPRNHFNVVTHQAFRDDMLHLAAQREGSTPEAVAERLDGMSPGERSDFMRRVMRENGIDHDFLAVDEGHGLLNRKGKENSHLANVVDAVSSGMGTYVNMTADPVKNDASEVFDLLAKMDPARYTGRDAFLRKYGVDTAAAKDGLKREMARHLYAGQVDPGVKAEKREIKVDLSPEQHAQLEAIGKAASAARTARMSGKVDVAALRTLSPSSFEGVDPARHEEVAAGLNKSIGILRDAAVHHAINGGAKTEAIAREVGARRGRPGVVFANRRDRVREIATRLEEDGHKVIVLTGADSAKEKDRKKEQFKRGDAILVASDAAAVGANLQTGKYLIQYDSPDTAMLHAQRQGRINRVGQTEDVELLDVVANHPEERKARKRLEMKYGLRDVLTSPLEGLDETGIAGMLNRVRAGDLEAAEPHYQPGPNDQAPEPDAQHALF